MIRRFPIVKLSREEYLKTVRGFTFKQAIPNLSSNAYDFRCAPPPSPWPAASPPASRQACKPCAPRPARQLAASCRRPPARVCTPAVWHAACAADAPPAERLPRRPRPIAAPCLGTHMHTQGGPF